MWLWRDTIWPYDCRFKPLNKDVLARLVENPGCFFKLWQASYEMRMRVGGCGARVRLVAQFVQKRDPWQGHLWMTKVLTQFKMLLRYKIVLESVRVVGPAAEICCNDFRCLCDEQAHALELDVLKAHVRHCPPFAVHPLGGEAKKCVFCLTVQPKTKARFSMLEEREDPVDQMATLAVSDGTETVVESAEVWVESDASSFDSAYGSDYSDDDDRWSQSGG